MARKEWIAWLAPAAILCVLWAAFTVVIIGLAASMGPTLPSFVTRGAPFLLAGLATARLADVSARRSRLVAAGLLALVSTAAWTSFSVVANELSADRGLVLFAVSLPVSAFAASWAYLGMSLRGLGRSMPATVTAASPSDEPHQLDELERELRSEMVRERAGGPSAD